MADYNEIKFEEEICEYLESHGWFYSKTDAGYDKKRALFPDDLLAWLTETQPTELAKVVKPSDSEDRQNKSFDTLLDRLVKVLDTGLGDKNGSGSLDTLRRGFKVINAKFDLAQGKPADTLNEKTNAKYAANRLRVMRQVYYSESNKKSIDLVFFLNGLPVATVELKTDMTQTCAAAVEQYKKARTPKDLIAGKREPLLAFGQRALVHFAVSNTDVQMTTKLDGDDTYFLPFNLGNNDGAGNPVNSTGSATSYLWERVWQRDAWLQIILKFMHLHIEKETNPITGVEKKKETLLFPRFHQWEAVTNLIDSTRTNGAGQKYLIQHSAGSGKTNSIAWTAHQLSTLHDTAGKKIFKSVIVVTDRNVLDDQLQDAIAKIDHKTGVVAAIGDDKKKSGLSKSEELKQALLGHAAIIVVTIQTFPFVGKALQSKGLAGQNFAIIADEAHSSQTGSTANKLKDVLTPEEIIDLEDGGEIDAESLMVDAILTHQMEKRAEANNISYYAFTATPKPKTLELFGTTDKDGKPRPFHLYTMKQAIEEKFILDVLLNYTPYDMAFQLSLNNNAANSASSSAAAGQVDIDGDVVDESAASAQLMNWVRLHPTNISQKVRIIVDHFRMHVEHELGGFAKAMVVTDSRKAAVRYKVAMDKYIADSGFTDVKTLVAFSGDVDDPETGPDSFNEQNMNPDLKGRKIAKAFEGKDFNVMLVANKFQTGFDQPLLCAMYVDKRLSGVTAVQTLSRLNRVAPGKERTYVIDFRNDPDEILESFRPYFAEARLSATTDPNLIHDLQTKLDKQNIYTDVEIDQTAIDWVLGKGAKSAHNKLVADLAPAVSRFNTAYDAAVNAGDKARIDELDMFRKDVDSFVRLYDFLSQVINYGDTELEKRQIFFRLLSRLIQEQTRLQPIDLTDVVLINLAHKKNAVRDLGLDGDVELEPMKAPGSGATHDPKLGLLRDIINRLNEQFDLGDFTEGDLGNIATHLVTKILENPAVAAQVENNTPEQVSTSPVLIAAFIEAILGVNSSYEELTGQLLNDEKKRKAVLAILLPALFAQSKENSAASAGKMS